MTTIRAGLKERVGEKEKRIVKEAIAQEYMGKWDKEADVVVVGFGAAGAVTAITARDAGAKVIILEKMPREKAGGNTQCCGGNIYCPTNVPDAIRYLKAFNGLSYLGLDGEIIRTFAEEIVQDADWIKQMGADVVPIRYEWDVPLFPELPGSESTRRFNLFLGTQPGENGFGLWKWLRSRVESRGIEVMYNTPARRLIADHCKVEVFGVMAEIDGKEVAVKAKRAVVLTCGGFEFSDELKQQYIGPPGYPVYGVGSPSNTGDGIKMAMEVGAALWHMTAYSGNTVCFKSPEHEVAWSFRPRVYNYIFVDGMGKRFFDETISLKHGKAKNHETYIAYPIPEPAYCVFDETTRLAGSLATRIAFPLERVSFSKDNGEEVAKGWIIKADTVEELAGKTGMDPATLKDTIATYNKYCEVGKDAEFSRPKDNLASIKTPPYYAIRLSRGMLNTQGGPKRNARAQIMHITNKPILRLYGSGELGSFWGFLYQGGGNIGECVACGRIAGRNAAAEKPWE